MALEELPKLLPAPSSLIQVGTDRLGDPLSPAHYSQTELCRSTRSLALSCADKPSGSFVEGLLMVPHTEQISRAFVEGGDRGVAVHPAHRAETFVGGETLWFGVDHVRVRVRPAAP